MTKHHVDKTPIHPAPTGEAAPVAAAPESAAPAPTFPDGAPIPAADVTAAEALPAGVPVAEVAPSQLLGAAFGEKPAAPEPATMAVQKWTDSEKLSFEKPVTVTVDIPKPSIGRIVIYRGRDGQFRAAIVTHVWGVFCVNLFVFPKDGSDQEGGPVTSVTHADPVAEPACMPSWHWMPYQLGQAAKTAAAEAKAAAPAVDAGALALEVTRLRASLVDLGQRIGHHVAL